ncbi:MAG: TonB-dependent receptor [Bacteroidetes bacterium]|nr:TonB-dependent receptor [Bacteroidota bacterium]
MMRKIYSTFLIVMVAWASLLAQSGSIKGKVVDATTNEPLPFANVVVELNGSQAGGSQTDFDGNFTIKPLNPGKYNLKASYVGYQATGVNGIIVSSEKITFQDVKMSKGAVDITQIVITEYKVPVIDKGNPSTQNTLTSEDIQAAPVRDVNSLVATSAGVFQKKEGDDLNIRGSRGNATDYYVDGVRVRGSVGLPQSGIEQITVVTGGIPANYGDATGGIVNITTRGPSKISFGGVELLTSQFWILMGLILSD